MVTADPAALGAAACATAVLCSWPGTARHRLGVVAHTARRPGVPTGRVFGMMLVLAGGLLAGWWGATAAAALWPAGEWLRGRVDAARRDAAERVGVAAVLSAVAGELRVGHPLDRALAAAAGDAPPRIGARLRAAASAEQGAATAAALVDGTDPVVDQLLRPVAAACRLAGSGAALAGLLDELAGSARADGALQETLRAELAGPRSTAVLLAGLPVVGTAMAAACGAQPARVLLHSAVGIGCLGAGVGLDACGVVWARHIVRSAVSP